MAASRDELSSILKDLSKKYDTNVGSISQVVGVVKGLTTDNIAIDHILGVHGLPVGRVAELYGMPSSGKTTCALQAAGRLQQHIKETGSDDVILYMDYEHALDKDYCLNLGLDIDDERTFLLAQPDTLEKGAAVARRLIETGRVRLMVWDSVAEATPDAIKQKETGEATVAVRAKIMSQFLQQINSTLFRNDCTAVFLNHLQKKIPTGYTRAEGETTPGGDALKFYSSVRLKFQQISATKGKRYNPLTNTMEDFTVSSDVMVTVTKNKVAPPQKSAKVRVRYGTGFDNFYTAVEILKNHKVLPSGSGYYYFEKLPHLVHDDMETTGTGRRAIRGEDNLLTFAAERPKWRAKVIEEAKRVVETSADTDALISSTEDTGLLLGESDYLAELEG